jgi:hypothetical protein
MQETAASEMGCSGSPRAALNVGPAQGMVALMDCLFTPVAVLNVGLTRLGARLVGQTVGW